jgi:hypothetical protein
METFFEAFNILKSSSFFWYQSPSERMDVVIHLAKVLELGEDEAITFI